MSFLSSFFNWRERDYKGKLEKQKQGYYLDEILLLETQKKVSICAFCFLLSFSTSLITLGSTAVHIFVTFSRRRKASFKTEEKYFLMKRNFFLSTFLILNKCFLFILLCYGTYNKLQVLLKKREFILNMDICSIHEVHFVELNYSTCIHV